MERGLGVISQLLLLVPFHDAKAPVWRPALNHETCCLVVQPGENDLADVGDKHFARRYSAIVGWGGGRLEDRTPRDLCLARPVSFLAIDRVESRPVQGEPRITSEVCALSSAWHRAEAELTVIAERALDAGDPWRTVGSHRCDRLVPASFHQLSHPGRERRFG